ncbi:MAG: VCBS repeat-containing protein, partial [Planctomycetes bacterium]|nr:VCBS repeat-containing protein [Planctomycetota bacterium]
PKGGDMRVLSVIFLGSFLCPLPTQAQWSFVRGDANGDASFDVGDAVFILDGLFGVPMAPVCEDAWDLDDDGTLDIADAVSALNALFVPGTPVPPPPFPSCGVDPTADGLRCAGPLSTCPSATFSATPDLVIVAPIEPDSVVVADLDLDGDLDLAWIDDLARVAGVLQQPGGTFSSVPDFTTGPAGELTSLFVADINGDLWPDLIVTDRSNDRISIHLAIGAGVYPSAPDVMLGDVATTPWPGSVVAAELDDVPGVDLATAHFEPGSLTIFFQEPAGTYPSVPDLSVGEFPIIAGGHDIVAADLDGDGDVDLATANYFRADVTLFLQSTPGLFPDLPDTTLGGPGSTEQPLALDATDLDGDGDQDLLVAMADGVAVFLQGPSGVFSTSPDLLLPVTTSSIDVATGDFNGDGRVDVVANDYAAHTLRVLFQWPDGTFPDASALTLGGPLTTTSPASIAVADLDGDGALDIVTANRVQDDITVFLGKH